MKIKKNSMFLLGWIIIKYNDIKTELGRSKAQWEFWNSVSYHDKDLMHWKPHFKSILGTLPDTHTLTHTSFLRTLFPLNKGCKGIFHCTFYLVFTYNNTLCKSLCRSIEESWEALSFHVWCNSVKSAEWHTGPKIVDR